MCAQKSGGRNPELYYLLVDSMTQHGHLKCSEIFNSGSEALKFVVQFLQGANPAFESSIAGGLKSLVVSISCGTPTNGEDHG
jgi:hypothetical protein